VSPRAEDLTADLLQDLTAEQERPTSAAAAARRRQDSPSAVVQASLFLAPRGWRRPGVTRDRGALTVSAGPVRVRLGRP
jgi:hypothetical protein